MSEVVNTAVIGDHSARIEGWDDLTDRDKQYGKLRAYDKALGNAGHAALHRAPASFFIWSMFVFTDANNNSKDSVSAKAPYPLTIWAADVGCESAAGSAGAVDILVDGTTILDAPEDVKTGAGVGQRVAPEADSEDVAFNSSIKIRQTGTGAGAMVGGQAHLYCQRL